MAVDLDSVELVLLGPGVAQHEDVVAAVERTDRMLMRAEAGAVGDVVARFARERGLSAGVARRSVVYVSDSPDEVPTAGVQFLGCADHEDTQREFTEAGVAVVDVQELAEALNRRWDAQWCARTCG